MQRLVSFVVALGAIAIGGCPPPPPATPQVQAAGCPAAKDIYTASYVISEPRRGRTGWLLPLHDQKVDSVAGKPEYQTIDPAAAMAAGVPAPPSHVWLLQPGTPPCPAKIGNYYAAAIDAPGTPNMSYGIELEGCPAPRGDADSGSDAADGEAIALDSVVTPSQCHLDEPQEVAARLGDTSVPRQWKSPTSETPIPAGLARVIPKHDCAAPGCETLWEVLEVDVEHVPAAWVAAVNWLQIGDPAFPCDWKADTFSGFFIPDSEGKATKITEGQEHPLILAAVLADATGPRVLFADGEGEYAAYDLGHGTATVGHHVVWLREDAASYAVEDHLGPQCNDEGSGGMLSVTGGGSGSSSGSAGTGLGSALGAGSGSVPQR